MNKYNPNTHQERREDRLKKKKEKMRQHGKNLSKVYKDALEKRIKDKK
jgi:hypothetical protein